jgi:hypothetical protein
VSGELRLLDRLHSCPLKRGWHGVGLAFGVPRGSIRGELVCVCSGTRGTTGSAGWVVQCSGRGRKFWNHGSDAVGPAWSRLLPGRRHNKTTRFVEEETRGHHLYLFAERAATGLHDWVAGYSTLRARLGFRKAVASVFVAFPNCIARTSP